jgi:hypothetical protein
MSGAAADDGWPGPMPTASRASDQGAAPFQSDAVMQEAADIATGRRAPYRTPSFLRWIAARGGVRPDANVEALLDAADRRHGGILSSAGRSADEWGEAIAEHAGMRQRPDQNQILDWMSEAANGRDPDWWRALHAKPEREEAARLARDIGRIAAEDGIPLRTRRAALDLIEQEAALYGGGRAAERAPSPEPAPPMLATFDAAAQERLRAASDATKARARTFAPLKDITRTRGTAGDFITPDAVVPQRIFVPGPKGAATVKSYLDAVGEEGRAPLHDFAVASLRRAAEKPDGTLDPARAAAWRAKHQDALRSLPETEKALASAADASAAVDALAASRRQAAEMRQAGIVGRIMNLEDPQDVTRAVGSIFGKQDAVAQMKRLAEATSGHDDARAGLRKAIAEHMNQNFISRTEAATSGKGEMTSATFQKFVLKNERALATVFNSEEVASLKRIADDLQRANRSIAAVRIPGQSNTAQDMAAIAKGERSTLSAALSTIAATQAGGPWMGLATALGATAINAARRAGMAKVDDLVRDALLDPALAKALLQKTPGGRGTQTLTRRLLHNALKGWDDGPHDDGPGGGAPSGGPRGGGNGSRGFQSPLEVFNPARRGDQLSRGGGTDLASGAYRASALREHEADVAGLAAPGLLPRVSGDADAGVRRGALNAPETILSGTGKPMPSKGAALHRLRALKLKPDDFDLRPTEGGFVAVRKLATIAPPDAHKSIRDDVRSRLAAAGVPEKELDANAAVMEAYYQTRAKRLGTDPETLYREHAPDVRAGEATRDLNTMKPQETVDSLVRSHVSEPAEDGSAGRLFVDPQAKTWDLFHGTTALNDFKRFDPSSEAAQIGASLQGAEKGVVFLTPNPEEAGRYASFSDPEGEAGARIFRVAVSPGKTAVFDIPALLRSGDERFATALKDAWARHDLGANGRDLNKELRAAKAMLARTDMDRPAIDHTLGATHAAIDLARKEGLDTVVVRGLNESKGGDQVIVLNPGRVKSTYAGDVMFQGDKATYRGAATLGEGRAVIELFQARDASTFMHEAGHVFLRDMVQDAAKVPAIKGDLDAVLKWFGTDDATKITREHHEQFARGFEQYLRDGKAPSEGLKRAFDQFKDWLTSIYRSLTDLGRPIPDNIRGVYDRLLSAERPYGAPETILSGTGKPMPSKGAALHRLRAMGRDPAAYDLRPVEGGFVAVRKQGAAQPAASGPFGPIHQQFRHDAQRAIARLMADRDGEAAAALHHPDVGDIDLVWGKAPADGNEGYGLAKIAAKHPEVLGDLQGFLGRLSVDPKRSGTNRVRLRDKSGQAVVRLDWERERKTWLLTAFEEKAGGSATTDTAALKVGDDTARPGTGTTNVALPAAGQKAGPGSSR